jgi:hypothetical protein
MTKIDGAGMTNRFDPADRTSIEADSACHETGLKSLIRQADTASGSIRAIAHQTAGGSLPAPDVYELLGSLKGIGSTLPQVLQQLAQGLERSLVKYEVTEDEGLDPQDSVTAAKVHLILAARFVEQFGDELDRTQRAISGQGYRSERQ